MRKDGARQQGGGAYREVCGTVFQLQSRLLGAPRVCFFKILVQTLALNIIPFDVDFFGLLCRCVYDVGLPWDTSVAEKVLDFRKRWGKGVAGGATKLDSRSK